MSISSLPLSEIDISGFEAVDASCIGKKTIASLSITKSHLQFNMQAVEDLQRCECVKMMINHQKRQILLLPAHSQSKDSFTWINPKTQKPSQIESTIFSISTFKNWGWDQKYRYKAYGHLVRCDKQVMLLFDFACPEVWDKNSQVKADESTTPSEKA